MKGPLFGTGLISGLRRQFAAPPERPAGAAGGRMPEAVRRDAAHAYLTRYYTAVPGFSSLFSAEVAAALLAFQPGAGIDGNIGEIGVLMGRSFIALALHAAPGDLCLAIDRFDWPANVLDDFMANCRAYGVDMDRLVTITAETSTLAVADVAARLDGRGLRYIHVDGGHTPAALAHDIGLAAGLLARGGIICLDDMLHAQYPELAVTVHDCLVRHAGLRVFCIVDRADIVAASKYLICATEFAEAYQEELRRAFPRFVFAEAAEFAGYHALILSKDAPLLSHYTSMINRSTRQG